MPSDSSKVGVVAFEANRPASDPPTMPQAPWTPLPRSRDGRELQLEHQSGLKRNRRQVVSVSLLGASEVVRRLRRKAVNSRRGNCLH